MNKYDLSFMRWMTKERKKLTEIASKDFKIWEKDLPETERGKFKFYLKTEPI